MSKHALQRLIAGFCLCLSGLIVAFWLAWQALVPVDFGYGPAYEWLDIQQHVQTYGPQNRFKQDFAQTSSEEHKRLFGAIVHGIQHDGEGLRRIFYTTADGRRYTLLRTAEAIHLEDVANLITFFNRVAWGAVILLIASTLIMKRNAMPAPTFLQMLAGLGGLLAVCGLLLVIAGPTQVFYWLHTHIFPQDHEWFFYYQDSLMTTLMKAPDLFGVITVFWVALALFILVAGYWGISRWLRPAPLTKAKR